MGAAGTGAVAGEPFTVHELGCSPDLKSTLCMLEPLGYENVTVPPGAIVTVLPVPPFA